MTMGRLVNLPKFSRDQEEFKAYHDGMSNYAVGEKVDEV